MSAIPWTEVVAEPDAPPQKPKPEHPLEAVVRRHQASIWRYLRALGCDPELAEELTQEAFVVALRRGLEDRGPAAVGTFLRRTARNLWLKDRRRKVSRREVNEADRVWFDAVGDDDAGWIEAVEHCLGRLGPRARRAVTGCHVEERSRQDLASELGLKVEGVKTLLRRAVGSLRECIEARVSR